MSEYAPLRWPKCYHEASWLRGAFRWLPVIGLDARIWSDLRRQQLSRDARVCECWPRDMCRSCISNISTIVSTTMRWPGPWFLPSDPLGIVLWQRPWDVDAVDSVLDELDGEFACPDVLMVCDDTWTYGEFIRKILRRHTGVCCRGPL